MIEPSGRIARNKNGTPLDGGGKASKAPVSRQARAINMNIKGKR